MSIDPRRTQPFPDCPCRTKPCRCSRWPDYRNRWGLPVSGQTYEDDVLATGPIALWMQDETAGLVAHCSVNPAQNGAYTGVTLANDNTGPFGTPAPFYDGANDYCDVNTATLQALLNAVGAECTVMGWAKVNGAGVWTDGAARRVCTFYDAFANRFSMGKFAVNNRLYDYWVGGGVAEDHLWASSSITWQLLTMTRSETADEVNYYLDDALVATDVTIGVWGSVGGWNNMTIGADSLVPIEVWHGWLGPVALWDRALPLATITALYNC